MTFSTTLPCCQEEEKEEDGRLRRKQKVTDSTQKREEEEATQAAADDDDDDDDFEENEQTSQTNNHTSQPPPPPPPPPSKQPSLWNPFKLGMNPRLDSGEEECCIHSNMTLANTMIELLSKHYPERLATALLVPGKGGSGYLLTALGGTLGLRAHIGDKRTRAKVHILSNPTEVWGYVHSSQLASFVGGEAPITPHAFEYQYP